MRSILLLLMALATVLTGSSFAQSDYPSKPVQIVVGFPPGGGVDIVARLLGAKLQAAWGQPVIVANRVGATSMVAMRFVAKAPPDGYTLLLNASVMPILPALYVSPLIDIMRDLEPVSQLTTQSFVLVVHPSVPVTSVQEFIKFAKSQPGKLNYGSGSATFQFTMELFKQQAGISVVHIPYKGTADMVTGLLAERIQVAFVDAPTLASHVKAGRLRGLAVTTPKRAGILPDVPTMMEAGVPYFEITGWFALFAPPGTPKAIVNKLYEESAKILQMPDTRDKLAALDCTPFNGTPEQLRATMASQMKKWITVARDANIKPE
jgi:tripartite-type tricarboxylate transporter receptor subunit TctC